MACEPEVDKAHSILVRFKRGGISEAEARDEIVDMVKAERDRILKHVESEQARYADEGDLGSADALEPIVLHLYWDLDASSDR